MKILITGAAGLVGSHLARRLAPENDLLALAHGDLDIADRSAVRRRVLQEKPELIVNCAVLQVDELEQEPARAQAVNVDGPRFLSEAANEVGAEIVHFSTHANRRLSASLRLRFELLEERRMLAFGTPLVDVAGIDAGLNPPDTVGDVGPNHYVQMVNSAGGSSYQIYDRNGNVV